jgi:hypothetical protein
MSFSEREILSIFASFFFAQAQASHTVHGSDMDDSTAKPTHYLPLPP